MSKAEQEKLAALIETWLADESGYDERVYPIVKARLEERDTLLTQRDRLLKTCKFAEDVAKQTLANTEQAMPVQELANIVDVARIFLCALQRQARAIIAEVEKADG